MLKSLFAMLVFCLLSATATAATHDYVLERAYVEDPSNALTLPQVEQQTVTPFKSLLTKGYSQSAFWIRLKIDAVVGENPGNLILRIEPSYLDEIELFDSLEPHKVNRFAGDRHAWSDYEYKSMVFNFVIPAAQAPRYVWMRLKTSSTNMMRVQAFQLDDEQKIDQAYQVLMGMLFLIVLMLVLWGTTYWLLHRDLLIGVFTLKQFIGLLFVGSYVGYGRLFLSDYLSPSSLDYLNSAFVLMSTFITIYFHYEFFRDYQIKNWWRNVFLVMLLATPIEIAYIFFGKLTSALAINMQVVMFISPFMLLMVLLGIDWKKLVDKADIIPRGLLTFFHVLFFMIALLTALPSMGFASLSDLAPHYVMIHGALTGIVIFVMLQYRIKRIYEKQVFEVTLAKLEAQNERRHRDAERNFLEMLNHEFRTSLSVLRMAIGSGTMGEKEHQYAENAIMSMNDVIERCQQVQQAEDGNIILQKGTLDAQQLLQMVVEQTPVTTRIQNSVPEATLIHTDITLLRVVIGNLLNNALKYGAKKMPIEVKIEVINAHLHIAVINVAGAIGMPDQAKIFQKYYRSSKAHSYTGSGLGLYLMKNIMVLLGGDLTYTPMDNLVKFELCLPL
jgi:signal transduction histidine kinase